VSISAYMHLGVIMFCSFPIKFIGAIGSGDDNLEELMRISKLGRFDTRIETK
jgi:hypothetical protein